MDLSVQVILGTLFALGYVITPIILIWGWARWARRPKQRSITLILSLAGFLCATASALVAVFSIMYAEFVHGFAFYDPRLMRILRIGTLLSLAGFVFGIAGVWRSSSLRWHSPISAVGTLAFWLCVATEQ